MSEFEYFHGFEAILYGLAFALLFSGAGKMIIHSKKITFYWVHLVAILLCFLILVELFYDSYFHQYYYVDSRLIPSKWHFLLIKVGPIGVLYLLVVTLFPNTYEIGVDFKEMFQSRDRKILSLISLFIVLQTIRSLITLFPGMTLRVVIQEELFYIAIAPNLFFALISGWALFKKNNHRIIVVLLVTALVFVLVLMSSPAVVPVKVT